MSDTQATTRDCGCCQPAQDRPARQSRLRTLATAAVAVSLVYVAALALVGWAIVGAADKLHWPGWAIAATAAMMAVSGGGALAVAMLTRKVIARLERANHRLSEANRQLAALDLTKSRFLRTSGHQLRGPVAAIHSMLTAMQEVGGLNARQFDLLRRTCNRCHDMMTQLDEMTLLSTIQETASPQERQCCDISCVAQQVVAAAEEEAKARGLKLSLNAAHRQAVAIGEDAAETILEHLVGNALKYTPAGGEVRLGVAARDGAVEITVSDTGIGIPAGQVEQVFREFFRGINARQVCGGTGLGLSIVKALVERSGGSISLRSTENEGTAFTVTLPAAVSAAAETSAAQRHAASVRQDAEVGEVRLQHG